MDNQQGFFDFITHLFDGIPVRLRPIIAISILGFVVYGAYLYLMHITQPSVSKDDCLRTTIVGKIIDSDGNVITDAVRVDIENSSFDSDNTVSNGIFVITGTKINVDKIIAVQITLRNKSTYTSSDIDLTNNIRYAINNCKVDLGSIQFNVPKPKIKIQQLEKKAILKKKQQEKTFYINLNSSQEMCRSISKRLNIKFAKEQPDYKIDIIYTGEIYPVNPDKTLYAYSGGNIRIIVNGNTCKDLYNMKLDRTLQSGNTYIYVENSILQQIENIANNNREEIITLIRSCL